MLANPHPCRDCALSKQVLQRTSQNIQFDGFAEDQIDISIEFVVVVYEVVEPGWHDDRELPVLSYAANLSGLILWGLLSVLSLRAEALEYLP